MSAHLRLRNLVKSYDGRGNAVDDLSLDIPRGEFLTLLGPSGSGKTTTLMMIAGFEAPTRGAIELGGADLLRRKPYERNIGVVFQHYALFPHMTVLGNVLFPLRMRGFPRARQRARALEILDLVGLSQFVDKYPRELSGGQQQRVALARGLVFDPDVLLLDEPLGALDKSLREQMQVELKRIHREVGITTIYVTHDQTEAMTMSDRIAVLRHGKLEQVAPPLSVYHRPATRFVAEFIGDSNILAGRLDGTRPGTVTLDGLGPIPIAPDAGQEGGTRSVDILVRPERIRLVGPDDAHALPIQVPLTIDAIVNYGDSLLVSGTARGRRLRMRLAVVPPGALLREGATVTVGWAPGDAHLIERDRPSPVG
jgi:putative spermidine/putrescine transport system ATP-binding protein